MLGHALYMKSVHGGKSKNDRIDAGKTAGLSAAACSHWPRNVYPFSVCPGLGQRVDRADQIQHNISVSHFPAVGETSDQLEYFWTCLFK